MEPVYLRALELDDLKRIHEWHNDATLYKSLTGTFRYVSYATVEKWLLNRQSFSTEQVDLAICLTTDSQHIGNIYLRDIDWVAHHGEVALFIGEANQRSKGYGSAAVRLLTKYAFQDLGLLRLYLFVLEDNKQAIRMYAGCGFLVEGKLHRHAFKEGKHKDVLVMGVCSEDGTSEEL